MANKREEKLEMVPDHKFGKAICPICHEDLKPIVEDLQVVSTCGHVLHELCLQKWFEYCSSTKKCTCDTCPVCQQGCSANDVRRLYFQSFGDQSDSVISQKVKDHEVEDPELLRGEVKRLEVKVSKLNSTLENQANELKEINEELCLCKERTEQEVASRNEALRQKTSIQRLLHSKSQELDKSTSECLRLQERNMALAKELAAFKLVSDLNLDEDAILKFASLGNEVNNTDTIDILRKSLVIRNRNYRELMAKCNLLGREKAHSSKKLEKAKEKIINLTEMDPTGGYEYNSEDYDQHEIGMEELEPLANESGTCCNTDAGTSSTICLGSAAASSSKSKKRTSAVWDHFDRVMLKKSDGTTEPKAICRYCKNQLDAKSSGGTGHLRRHMMSCINKHCGGVDPTQTLLSFNQGDVCFSGGLLGPGGTNQYLGKWCNRGQNKGLMGMQGSTTKGGDLIVVGADGRGDKIKVLLSSNHSSQDGKENSSSAKRLKYGAKPSSL